MLEIKIDKNQDTIGISVIDILQRNVKIWQHSNPYNDSSSIVWNVSKVICKNKVEN